MSDICNGVIQISTGYLLRYGYTDFENDGSFDPSTEEQIPNCPNPAYCLNDPIYPDSTYITVYVDGQWGETLRNP